MAVVRTIVAECLRLDRPIGVPILLRRLHRIGVSAGADGQPDVWTLIDFTCADADAASFAEVLVEAVWPGPWYADFANESTKYVVFAGRVLVNDRDDRAGQEKAVTYARSVGVVKRRLG